MGLAGTCFAVGTNATGDTLLGCALVASASLIYALQTVLLGKVRDPRDVSISQLLGLEGLLLTLAVIIIGACASMLAPDAVVRWFLGLPSVRWLVFLAVNSAILNGGWLWCSHLAGAFWTAMVACSTIPISMGLDALLSRMVPSAGAMLGSLLVLASLALVSFAPAAAPSEPDAACSKRWSGWMLEHATPFLATE